LFAVTDDQKRKPIQGGVWSLFSVPKNYSTEYIMSSFLPRNLLYSVHLARHASILECHHHHVLQIICLQILICNVTFVLHTQNEVRCVDGKMKQYI
jgi:hypothetical protein